MATMSKSKKVENYLRGQIAQGIWGPGDRLPRHDEIGVEMGVSEVTVKNALVRLADEGLLERKQRLGTCVASSVTASNIGILCPAEALSSKVGFYYQRLLDAAKSVICGSGFRPVLAVGHGKGAEFTESLSLLDSPVAKNTVGAFVIACPPMIHQMVQEKGIHAVSIGPDGTEPSVVTDYAKGLELAAQQLHEYGYDDYVLMTMDPHPSDRETFCYKERERMICECSAFGRDRWVSMPWCGVDYGSVYEEFKQFWASGRRPRAIFFPDDGVCDIASRAILELGIKVPDELGIITEACVGRKFNFPLKINRVEYNSNELIATAYDMLEKLIRGEELGVQVAQIAPRVRPGVTL